MLLDFNELTRLRHQVAMVDGGFDPLHAGHIAYFRTAADTLRLPVLCNIASDAYVRTKHEPLLPQEQRAAIIDAIRYIAYTHINTLTTEAVLRQLRPRYYVKGADWRGRLPAAQVAIAAEFGIEIVFLETVVESSTSLLQRFLDRARQPGG